MTSPTLPMLEKVADHLFNTFGMTRQESLEYAKEALFPLLQPDEGTVEAMAKERERLNCATYGLPWENAAIFTAAISHILGEEDHG